MTTTRIRDTSRDRYNALSISQVWDRTTVRGARALIVGAGALGNEVAKNLAMLGVRVVFVLDRDIVEVANVSRSVFFREADHGRPKARVIAGRIEELNPDVEVITLEGDLEETLGIGLIRRVDMVFSCLDNRLARRQLNRMCQRVGKAWVDGAMEDLLGDVTVFLPDEGPCYECTLTDLDREIIAHALSCRRVALRNAAVGKVPTTSTMGSIVGAIQVQEAMKLLHGRQSSIAGKRFVVNCLGNDFYAMQTERKSGCLGHSRFGAITAVPEWSAAATTAVEILARLRDETGQEGHLRLGRDVVLALACNRCAETESLERASVEVSERAAACERCGSERELVTTNVVQASDAHAAWPLAHLGVPALEVLEARTADTRRWYELTGDLPPQLREEDGETRAPQCAS